METWTWPVERAGDALAQLAEAARLSPRAVDVGTPTADLETWLDEAARCIGVEVIAVSAPVAQIEDMIERSTPAVICVPGGVIAVLSAHGGRAVVLPPDARRLTVPVARIASDVSTPRLDAARAAIAAQVESLAVTPRRGRQIAKSLLVARTRGHQVGGVLSLRLAPEAPLRAHARAARLASRFSAVAVMHAVSYVLGVGAWWALGRGALTGRLETGWLAAWALLILSAVLLRIVTTSSMGHISIDAAALIKQRLLLGALRIELDTLRAEGVGHSLGRVFEAMAFERLTIGGGFLAMFAMIELGVAAVVLGFGAGGVWHVGLLLATLAATAIALRRYVAQRSAWTQRRMQITHALVESMVGHATRLAQQPPLQRHDQEDRALQAYTAQAAAMDSSLVALRGLIPRAWMIIAVAGLAPLIVRGGYSPANLALALGGVLLARSALVNLTSGAAQLASASIAWRGIEPLLSAAARKPAAAMPSIALATPSAVAPVATIRGVAYRPPRRARDVLHDCDLVVQRGDRMLLEGPSGSGKSTLAAVIAGVRHPDAGIVLAGGLDRAVLGETGWRRRVACAPQFHDNHLFSATLAFNLLIGRAWPPQAADLADAHAICAELGLDAVIERMPSQMFEMVGETGWQLSHGERCRVFLARALLQDAPLVVLDESLAALDPATLQLALDCIEKRATAAIVIAHP